MAAPPIPSLPEVLELLRRAVETHYHRTAVWVDIHLADAARPMSLPLTPMVSYGSVPVQPSETSPSAERPVFVPTPFQEAILSALEGKALRTDALGNAVGDRSRLFRHPGGLKELQEQGLAAHHPRRGYYRPDAPPEELIETDDGA